MQLILQAAKIQITYSQLQEQHSDVKYMTREWERWILELTNKFEEIDETVKSKYREQSGYDINEFAGQNSGMGNKDFSSGLINMLAGKYYWRNWFAVIYNPIEGGEKHWVRESGGHIKFRKNGRNIVIASKDKYSPKMNSGEAQRRLDRVSSRAEAHDVYNSIQSANNAASWGVIKRGEKVWYCWSGGTNVDATTRGNRFNLFMWG